MPKAITTAERQAQLQALEQKPGYHGRLRLLQTDGPAMAKAHLEFHCLDCGSGRDGGWRMQPNNVLYGMGCPFCEVTVPLLGRAAEYFPDIQVRLLSAGAGRPDIHEAHVEVRPRVSDLPADFGWEPPILTLDSFKVALYRGGPPPGSSSLRIHAELTQVMSAFRNAFPQGRLRYLGKRRPGYAPAGKYFSMETGPRLLRAEMKQEWIREQGVLGHVTREERDREIVAELKDEAAANGAQILGFETGNRGNIVIRYRSRTGFTRRDTVARVREYNWGQIHFRKGQALAFVCLRALVHANDWQTNHRPEFMEGLELDIFSPSMAVALEYNGPHHYGPIGSGPEAQADYERQARHDKRRRDLCSLNGITLLEMKHEPLVPATFLEKVTELCSAEGLLMGTELPPALEQISAEWDEICRNPLAAFQAAVQAGLGEHELLSPALDKVHRGSTLTYICADCGTVNEASARGFGPHNTRTVCPACKGMALQEASLAETLEVWSALFPEDFLHRLSREAGDLLHTCPAGHGVKIHGEAHVRRHMGPDGFNCPVCVGLEMNISSSQVAQLGTYQDNLRAMVEALGLKVERFAPYQSGEPVVEVSCPEGHRLEMDRRDIQRALQKRPLQDGIAPHACPECCYPGLSIQQDDYGRSTLFHRLHILQGMYPQAKWIGGFDPKGIAPEQYSCGECHADGSPHPVISISFKNLQKAAKRAHRPGAPTQPHLCITCGMGTQAGIRSKTLADLESMMMTLRDQIALRVALPQTLSRPKVEIIGGELREDGGIHTQKTVLRLDCGVPGHVATETSYDYYFNRAPGRGYGFCPACCKSAGLSKAPQPPARKFGKLRLINLTS